MSDAEIVLGVVAPVGTRVQYVEEVLRDRLEHFGYELKPIRLSRLIAGFDGLRTVLRDTPHGAHIATHMDAGDELRKVSGRADVLALAAVNDIQAKRREMNGEPPRPLRCVAYFLRSLKHPDEVRSLREIYGSGFFLLGVSSSREARLQYLCDDKNVPEEEAKSLLKRDESDEKGHGQQTRDAFQMADAFIALGSDEDANKRQLWRLLDLLFGQTFLTPTREEHAMFLAYATSLRSADLSRQVGAIILSVDGEVIATGANDVPQASGGQYWTDGYVDWPRDRPVRDRRDWVIGKDTNRERKNQIVQDFADRVTELARLGAVAIAEDLVDEGELRNRLEERLKKWAPSPEALQERLRGSLVMDLTEFGRAVHAEMEALLCCARVGVSPRNGRLFTTTFPCHNCTKHIVAAGVAEVHFIEPYPKSLAEQLHADAVLVAPAEIDSRRGGAVDGRVVFRPFSGVGPRRFLDLFSLGLGAGRAIDRKKDVRPGGWSRKSAQLRVSMVPTSYLQREDGAVATLKQVTKGDADEHPQEH